MMMERHRTKVKVIIESDVWTPMEVIDWLFENVPEDFELADYEAQDWVGRECSETRTPTPTVRNDNG